MGGLHAAGRAHRGLADGGVDIDLIAASRDDSTLGTVRSWLQSGSVPPWSACAGLYPELRCWRLQLGNLSVDSEGRLWRGRAPPSEASQLVVPIRERQDLIRRFHDSLFTGHLLHALCSGYRIEFIGRAYFAMFELT